MRKHVLGLGIFGALVLSGCGVLGGANSGPDVSGQLNGNLPSPKLALIGVNDQGVFQGSSQQQLVLNGVGFDFNLPKTAAQGIYQIIAYSDTNGNGQYDLNEPRSDNNKKYLVYSNQAATFFGKTVGVGWTLYDQNADSTTQARQFTGYDLNYTAPN